MLGYTTGTVKQILSQGVFRQGDNHSSEMLTVLYSLVFNHLAPITG